MCVTDGDVWNALFAIDSIFVCFDLIKVSRSHSAMIHGIVSEGSANAAYDFYYFTRYNCLVRHSARSQITVENTPKPFFPAIYY